MYVRGENIGCGTSTTGTGTLTLATPPSVFGLIDPVTAFGTSGAWPVSYVLTEYTNSNFTTILQQEIGVGILTLAATLGTSTLARGPQVTNVPGTPAYNSNNPTAISIGVAANAVITIAPTAKDLPQSLFTFSTTGSGDGTGILPVCLTTASGTNGTPASGTAYYCPVKLDQSGLIATASMSVAIASNATSSSLEIALYELIPRNQTNAGLPGKRIIEFGVLGGNPLASTGTKSITATTPAWINAGWYAIGFLPIYSGQTTSPQLRQAQAVNPTPFGANLSSAGQGAAIITVAGQSSLTDPATLTSFSALVNSYIYITAFRDT